MAAKLRKMPLSCILDNPSKKFLDPDPQADDIHSLVVSSLSKNTSLVRFSWRSY